MTTERTDLPVTIRMPAILEQRLMALPLETFGPHCYKASRSQRIRFLLSVSVAQAEEELADA
jgi:hypothetical protein